MKKETLKTISARTGYSITSISRVLNGKAAKYRISKKTADAILREVGACGYQPLFSAQKQHKAESGLVGLLLPLVSNIFFAEMASVIISELHSNGYTAIVMDMMENPDNLMRSLKALLAHNVEGIIVSPCGDSPVLLEKVAENIPVVLIDRYFPDSWLPYVTTDNFKGGMDGTAELIRFGHKKITCIQGPLNSEANLERVRGYKEAMRAEGLENFIDVTGSEFSIDNGYLKTKILLARPDRPTAIFALSNMIFFGAMKAIREARLRIPDDISVVSFDDYVFLDYLTPPITRVGQPVHEMASLATKMLLDRLGGGSGANSKIKLAPSIVGGKSVRVAE